MDEEKKVEAVRDFYENAVGDDVAVERLQAIGMPIAFQSIQNSFVHQLGLSYVICQLHSNSYN